MEISHVRWGSFYVSRGSLTLDEIVSRKIRTTPLSMWIILTLDVNFFLRDETRKKGGEKGLISFGQKKKPIWKDGDIRPFE